MLKQNARLIDLGFRIFDLLLLVLALPAAHLAYSLAPMARTEAPSVDALWGAMIAVLILWIAASGSGHVYGTYRTQGPVRELGRIARALTLVGLTALGGLYFVNSHLPRIFLASYFVIAFGLLLTSRITVRMIAHTLHPSGYNTQRFAIVGPGAAADEVAQTIASQRRWGYELAGFILPDAREESVPKGKVLGVLGDLERILDDHVFDEIVFAMPRDKMALIEPAMKICEEQGVTVLVSLEPLQLGTSPVSLFELSGLSMLVFNRKPADVLSIAAKYLFDLTVSGLGLILLTPVFLAVAAAIKLDSPGPVFFRQTRVGLSGRHFPILKFRSMFTDAEARLQALQAQNEMTGPVFKMKNDPRITRVGRFIRKMSIDELPQLWNVFCGQMSIVGPRPPLPTEVRQYKRWQRRRLSVRPGITCTWQVSGRNGISFERWMELDLEYIDNWSLSRDMRICLQTIPAVLTARGAH